LDFLYEGCLNTQLSSFDDETAYEHFVNHVHIDQDSTAIGNLWVALGVLNSVSTKCTSLTNLTLRHIISCDESSCVYSFHVVREGQSLLSDELETYGEAVLEVEFNSDEIGPHNSALSLLAELKKRTEPGGERDVVGKKG
jgi:hypothetical protein